MRKTLWFTALTLSLASTLQAATPWFEQGQQALQQRLAQRPLELPAKNVILFLGDGMSLATVNAARIYEGQLRGENGEENLLSFEKFLYSGLVKTYNTNAMVPDSAGTMSAIMTGVKTGAGILSMSELARYGDCASGADQALPSLLTYAESLGKRTGIVTTTRITHATPAAAYAHSVSREWEDDGELPEQAKVEGCKDIALQLLEYSRGNGIEVLLGGGRRHFLPESENDPEYPDKKGERKDGRNLLLEWMKRHPKGEFVWDKRQFEALSAKSTHVLGLFEPSHMAYEAEKLIRNPNEPSLSEMTAKAIQLLQNRKDGFFLIVEGGRIDHAHHAGSASMALLETIEFAKAVQTAKDLTAGHDTLIVVTADHGHTLQFSGYARRGNPILGKVESIEAHALEGKQEVLKDLHGLPYTVLNYMNGPGFGMVQDEPYLERKRPDLSTIDTTEIGRRQESLIPLGSETHSGEDVPVYAYGPWAHLFTGVHEQNALYHYMRHAMSYQPPKR
ncbi:alkaline phosphatase [Permianibacter aggregans]|uniref:alkaline phosphatase n=1 Tax=Permianibacter aggregans TaxID=1510150 RepID=UPI00105BBE17|nr:alkaline phosphatase [Permianibacter aggregans]QGX39219.1 alkaline phosphatase [Permianibacter aggregans]